MKPWQWDSEKQYQYESEWKKQNFLPLEVRTWSGGYSSREQIWSACFCPWLYMSVVNPFMICTSAYPSVRDTHLYLIRSSSCQVHCWQPFAVRNAGFHKWKVQVISTLPGRPHHFFQLYTYKQMVVISDWLKNLFILLVASKDFELNLYNLQRSVAP